MTDDLVIPSTYFITLTLLKLTIYRLAHESHVSVINYIKYTVLPGSHIPIKVHMQITFFSFYYNTILPKILFCKGYINMNIRHLSSWSRVTKICFNNSQTN